jgi:hypothetical protein
MASRYDLRQDAEGWTVLDAWTGETVVIALVPQAGLLPIDAAELVSWLNRASPAGRAGPVPVTTRFRVSPPRVANELRRAVGSNGQRSR